MLGKKAKNMRLSLLAGAEGKGTAQVDEKRKGALGIYHQAEQRLPITGRGLIVFGVVAGDKRGCEMGGKGQVRRTVPIAGRVNPSTWAVGDKDQGRCEKGKLG